MKAADIPNLALLSAVAYWDEGIGASVWNLQSLGFPVKIIEAKARRLIKRGWLDGCMDGGCRGDFSLTEEGEAVLIRAEPA